ncbi:MAG: hypothetical protein FWC78_08955 [Defluviitaleaceae bacterium]|nr:hypothetical protein [Defluviitaleaceae bacterium]
MRKYIITVFVLMIAILVFLYAYFYMGFFIDFRPNAPVQVAFHAEEGGIFRAGEDTPLLLRGVEVVAFVPSQSYWQLGASHADFLRWFGYISDMGATTVYAASIMHSSFYNALYTFNADPYHDNYLLLIHGVGGLYVDDMSMYLRRVIDIVHGNRVDLLNRYGVQLFLRDISPWVVAYVINTDINPDHIAYINNNVNFPDSFEGRFFSTAPEANRFEALLAEVMDNATEYETRRFKAQRPISFLSSPLVDFLRYQPFYAVQLRKYAHLDHENIIPSAEMQAGHFAAYTLFYLSNEFLSLLHPVQRIELADILEDLDVYCNFGGYFDLLARYHTVPVVAVGFGATSSRTPGRIDAPAINERQQGHALASLSMQLEERGWAGNIISSWQDDWSRRTWNTAFAADPYRSMYWNNVQSQSQGYGLMSFDPGQYYRPVRIDGVPDEWTEANFIHEYDGIRIYAKQSVQNLYLLVRGEAINQRDVFYLPIKLSPNSGTDFHEHLKFDMPANFLLRIHGANNTRLMVTMRNNQMFMRFHEEITGENPFLFVPERWISEFVPINIAMQNTTMTRISDQFIREEYVYGIGMVEGIMQVGEPRDIVRLLYRETGRLIHGINDPNHPNFNSIADFHFGHELVEIRLPWGLLNFFDPSNLRVHDDYYDNFGVDGISISDIYIGIGHRDSTQVPMSPFRLQGWRGNLQFHERLKLSYFIMQEAWRG